MATASEKQAARLADIIQKLRESRGLIEAFGAGIGTVNTRTAALDHMDQTIANVERHHRHASVRDITGKGA